MQNFTTFNACSTRLLERCRRMNKVFLADTSGGERHSSNEPRGQKPNNIDIIANNMITGPLKRTWSDEEKAEGCEAEGVGYDTTIETPNYETEDQPDLIVPRIPHIKKLNSDDTEISLTSELVSSNHINKNVANFKRFNSNNSQISLTNELAKKQKIHQTTEKNKSEPQKIAEIRNIQNKWMNKNTKNKTGEPSFLRSPGNDTDFSF
eukprot:UN00603